jgi:predicted MFS family arabinose efflux permease
VNTTDSAKVRPSPWSPFRYTAFTVIWVATVVANIGSWMYSASAAWLMTSLDGDPLMVSLVQVASTLPVFLFALPAGALADIVDRRRFLIAGESFTLIVSTAFAALIWFHLITPLTLLLFVFLIEAGGAVTAPAWQSVVPDLVPKKDLPGAVSMNSVGVNVSRAIGPALGGLITARFGIAAPFWVNAVSNLGTLGALVWWRSPHDRASQLPAEHFTSAIRTGVRYARNNRYLRSTLVRAAAFFLSASCYWALLPLVARHQIGGGATFYGVLLGAIGASAIVGAFALPWLRAHIGPNRLVAAGSIGTAVTLVLFGAARTPVVGVAASLIAGVSWIVVLATLNVSAQFALPGWVRGRGLAVYVTGFFGALTLGSVVWGQVARVAGVPLALFIAAAAAVLTIPLTWHWTLQSDAALDLTPSMHWPTPLVSAQVDQDAGPVLVTVEYRVGASAREGFLRAMVGLSHERHRDGAYDWGIFEDVAQPGRFLETFLVESWLEHLRQHERVTNTDRVLQEQIQGFVTGTPTVTHFIAPRSPSG